MGISAIARPREQVLMRRLPFIEFMELLEFSHLRFEPPEPAAGAALLGTLEWRNGPQHDAGDTSGIYVCSTLEALRDAVLSPEAAEIHIDSPARGRIRLRAIARHRSAAARPPCIRVDLSALIRRVLVPAAAPAHLYDLVRHVVMTRLWIEVARV